MAGVRNIPPMPVRTELVGTVRDLGTPRHEVPVARVTFLDVTGDTRQLDFPAREAFDLAMQLLTFVRQVGAGSGS